MIVQAGGLDVSLNLPNTKLDLGSMPTFSATLNTDSTDVTVRRKKYIRKYDHCRVGKTTGAFVQIYVFTFYAFTLKGDEISVEFSLIYKSGGNYTKCARLVKQGDKIDRVSMQWKASAAD